MNKSKFIEKSLESFDEWRNDGEHCSIDDSVLNKFDVIMLKDFLQSKLSECWDMAGEEIVNKAKELIGKPASITPDTSEFVEGKIVILREVNDILNSLTSKQEDKV